MFHKSTIYIALLAIIPFIGIVYAGQPCVIATAMPFKGCAIRSIDETECIKARETFMKHFSCQESTLKKGCKYLFTECDEKKTRAELDSYCNSINGFIFNPFFGTPKEGNCA